jgi:hypothetical protein
VKITSSTSHVVLNQIQWFILVTFKSYKVEFTNLVTHVITCLCTVDGISA